MYSKRGFGWFYLVMWVMGLILVSMTIDITTGVVEDAVNTEPALTEPLE